MSLFEELGGNAAIEAAVDNFYVKVLSDAQLKPFFDGMDMGRQKGMMRGFLTFAFGGPNNYTGRGMRAAHSRVVEQGLNDSHFDAVAGHLEDTLRGLGVPDAKVQQVLSIAESTRADVLGR